MNGDLDIQAPLMTEDYISLVPALQLFNNIGWQYLTPSQAVELRGGRLSGVLLDGVLEDQLRKQNRIQFKGQEHLFSESNIHNAVMALKDVLYDGLVRTNEKLYDLLCWGKSLQQSISGDTKSFPLRYIDFNNPENNVYHVTDEFVVERSGSHETRRPDIVLFVNGIPLAVIECKRPDLKDGIEQAVSQHIRNQRDDEIPRLYLYSQLLLAVSKNEAKYATTGTAAKFWAVWKERGSDEAGLRQVVNTPLDEASKERLFSEKPREVAAYFDELKQAGPREITQQDRTIHALCRPERLLELMFRFILFDAGEKKVARYQQYFCVQKIMERIRRLDREGMRPGGVVWHTQGSGKSLTMVMLANAIALEPGIDDYKIVLVTDRIDLDDQIYKTFRHCGTEPEQAKTGKHLVELLGGHKQRIVTTLIDKFEAAVGKQVGRIEDPDIFVLVDEGHRGQYGPMHARMRKVLPNACFIAFTGTPVIKKQKNTIDRFGGLIDSYTITEAVDDKAVVPLLYEGRHVDQIVDQAAIDAWFERVTEHLTKEQTADLKRKFARTEQLNKAEQKVRMIAWDVGSHFRDTWQGTPFKGQLVAQDKATALLYKRFLDEFGMVTSEVLISGPDDREGNEDIYEGNKQEVVAFWKKMMAKYGNSKEYDRQLINAFKNTDEPEIIIVVDKLLTGFDAPRNTVLYLTRQLRDHTLLQAIARVNRLYEGKEFGYIIDYRGVLENLDRALDVYGKLAEFDIDDLLGTVTPVDDIVAKLPQRHSDLWAVFAAIRNKKDEEAYELLLGDQLIREEFYDRLSAFSRTLAIALATVSFIEKTPDDKIRKYKADLKFFMNLRTSVRRRYAEVVDFKEYELKIQKLIDTHVGTGEVEKLTGLVNIFDADAFAKEIQNAGGTASKADTIAYRTKRTISERMQEDPAFYRKFSELLEEAIRAFKAQRISDAEYLRRVAAIRDSVRDRSGDDVPSSVRQNEVARALYGVVLEAVAARIGKRSDAREISAEAGLQIDEIIREKRIVNWTTNIDVQNQMKNEIEDYLFDLKERRGLDLTFDDIDRIMEQCLDIARVRYNS